MEDYDGRQVVGMDLHRRRSVLVRMTGDGRRLGTAKITNSPAALRREIARAGTAPKVVLEATYGWYWAADTLAAAGAEVHLAHPLGVKAFTYRRVKNDERDSADLADLLRMGRLPEAWIAPREVRELRELTRYRIKLVRLRTSCNPKAKRWLAVWATPDGRETTRAFAKQSDAVKYATAMEADALRGTYIDPKAAKVTVAQWCDTWLSGYETRRPGTVRQARVHLKQITAEFGPLPLPSVRPSHVKAWTSRLSAEGLEASYVYALHARLAQVMSDAVHDGLLAKSPCSRRTSPGQGKQRPHVATTAQVWALHDAMPTRLRAAVLLGAFAGLRCAEACGLRVADVDFMRGIIRPAVQYPAEPLKTEVSRTAIPIARSLALELSGQVACWAGETVLTGRHGGQLGPWALERAIRTARGQIDGLPDGFRYHDLQHYLASLLIADGADVKTVQARLRHASAKTTLDTYGHLWPDRDESTRAAIEAVFVTRRTEQGLNQQGAP